MIVPLPGCFINRWFPGLVSGIMVWFVGTKFDLPPPRYVDSVTSNVAHLLPAIPSIMFTKSLGKYYTCFPRYSKCLFLAANVQAYNVLSWRYDSRLEGASTRLLTPPPRLENGKSTLGNV